LYVSDNVLEQGLEPLFIDMRGADWIAEDRYQAARTARRFENWEFAWALVLATGVAAQYAIDIGIENIRDRVQALATQLRTALSEIDGVRLLDRGSELCGIVSVAFDSGDPADLAAKLRARRINTTAQIRIYAVIDYEQKGVSASLRLSPHYFNTEQEIDEAAATLQELLAST
jgi:selenocysteine lyase/cysteine desulfurase